jgi:hypothetical protein
MSARIAAALPGAAGRAVRARAWLCPARPGVLPGPQCLEPLTAMEKQ